MKQVYQDSIEMAHIRGQLNLINLICNLTPCNIPLDLEFILKGWEKIKKEELEVLRRKYKN